MAITYTQYTVANSRSRNTSQLVGTNIYCPADGAAICGVIDTTTDTYSEFALSTSRTRRVSELVGSTIYLPSRGNASCGKIDTTSNTFSEFTYTGSAGNWNTSQLVGSTIYLFSATTLNRVIVGKINTSSDTYSETIFTRVTPPTGSPQTFSSVQVGGLIYTISSGGTLTPPKVGVYNPGANTWTEFTSPSNGGAAAVVVGTDGWFSENNTTSFNVVDTGTSSVSTVTYTGTSGVLRSTAVVVGTTIWFPGSLSAVLLSLDTATGTATEYPILGSAQARTTSQLVGDKIYIPHNGHASFGVISGIPLLSNGFFSGQIMGAV